MDSHIQKKQATSSGGRSSGVSPDSSSGVSPDRISNLPPPVLHHILRFLGTAKNDAVRTSVLSKSWRHLWSTHPRFTLKERYFGNRNENQQQFIRVLEKTLQGYCDQNLCLDEFHVETSTIDPAPLLDKWIPIVVHDLRVAEFRLACALTYTDLPSAVFQSEHLRKLHLSNCTLDKLDSFDTLHLKNLRRLVFEKAPIRNDTLDKLISSCPLLEHLELLRCDEGLENIRVVNVAAHNLRFVGFTSVCVKRGWNTSIEINVPAVEGIRISNCLIWSGHLNHDCFRRLKSLYLQNVLLSKEWFDSFSSDFNFPSIENLHLEDCHGFMRFQILSASIKTLRISFEVDEVSRIEAAVIHAPSIVDFHYCGPIPLSFTFTTASREWSSDMYFIITAGHRWKHKLNKVLRALRGSKIYLGIRKHGLDPGDIVGRSGYYKPVVLEQLRLDVCGKSALTLSKFVHSLFRIFSPREIGECFYNAHLGYERVKIFNKLAEILCKTLLMKGNRDWKWHLQEAILEACDHDKRVDWRRVEVESWVDPRAVLDNKFDRHRLRFRLTWR